MNQQDILDVYMSINNLEKSIEEYIKKLNCEIDEMQKLFEMQQCGIYRQMDIDNERFTKLCPSKDELKACL